MELKRKKQMNELAKNKYKKMIETRQKSVIEKRELTKVHLLRVRNDNYSSGKGSTALPSKPAESGQKGTIAPSQYKS